MDLVGGDGDGDGDGPGMDVCTREILGYIQDVLRTQYLGTGTDR